MVAGSYYAQRAQTCGTVVISVPLKTSIRMSRWSDTIRCSRAIFVSSESGSKSPSDIKPNGHCEY